jgi:hypothetical protein
MAKTRAYRPNRLNRPKGLKDFENHFSYLFRMLWTLGAVEAVATSERSQRDGLRFPDSAFKRAQHGLNAAPIHAPATKKCQKPSYLLGFQRQTRGLWIL